MTSCIDLSSLPKAIGITGRWNLIPNIDTVEGKERKNRNEKKKEPRGSALNPQCLDALPCLWLVNGFTPN